jgi:hypothetical protein
VASTFSNGVCVKYRPPAASATVSKTAGTTTFFFMAALAHRLKMFHGTVDEAVAGDETMGIVGIDGAERPTPPVMGDTLVVGSGSVGLVPRLPIW